VAHRVEEQGAAGRIAELDTPVLTIDLDVVERNLAALQARCDGLGLRLRPHIKTHKLPELARLQMRAGAVGIACQKLGEAEVMAAAGLRDILMTYPLVGVPKARRFAALAREIEMSAVGDSELVVRGLSAALEEAGAEAAFLVECDTGYGRTGVQTPAEAAALGALADSLPGLRFAGFMTYPTLPETGAWLDGAIAAARERGLDPGWISGGGTPLRAWAAAEHAPALTEVRAGTYVYGDRMCVADGSAELADCALRVRATVVSRPTADRAILDTGTKALTSDTAPGLDGYGHIVEYPGARMPMLNEEHGYVDLSACAERPEVGDVVSVVPNHACGTTNMYDEVYPHRNGELVGVWPVAARGRLR
jgi:D-serine deaminase-like pyridoxal phosphate-dependent protein